MDVTLFNALGRYFWLICLAMSAYQYYAAGCRIDTEDDLSEPVRIERNRYMQVFIGASALPWVVMGIGQMTGSTSSVWDYFRPQDMNPFVLAFVGSVFALSVAMVYWVFFMQGAQKVAELKLMQSYGFFRTSTLTERQVKLFAAFGPVFVIAWVAMCVLIDAPIHR